MDDVEYKTHRDTTCEETSVQHVIRLLTADLIHWRDRDYFPSVLRPTLLMIVSIFLIEIVIEYSLANFVNLSLARHVLLDAGATVLLLSPIFYFTLYRPFKSLDAAHCHAQDENQLLSRKLIRRTEEEKQRLARDLHDDFGQVLTALQFGLATLKESYRSPTGQGLNFDQQADRLTHMVADLGDQVRSFTLELRPVILDELGMKPAIQVLIEGDWAELEITLEEQGVSCRCAPEIELAIFRFCQEALNNILKHAHATHAEICLSYRATELQLRISDNGVGFDIEALRPGRNRRRGFGLLGLRERVASLDGRLELTSTPGGGTTILINIPLDLQRRRDETDPDPDR